MNEEDSRAHSKAVDSLLNFETVKYFNAEKHEAGRFDQALGAYEKAAVKSSLSLSALNVGQAVIISVGLVAVMMMAAVGIQKRHDDAGRIRDGERLSDPALSTAQYVRVCVS